MNNDSIEIQEKDKEIIKKYNELDIKSTFITNKADDYKQRITQMAYQYKKIREEILKINNDSTYVTDILIKYLYSERKNDKKITLWECFGDTILDNLKNNLTKDFKKEAIECERCGILIERTSNTTKYCPQCWKEEERRLRVEINRKYYEKHKKC